MIVPPTLWALFKGNIMADRDIFADDAMDDAPISDALAPVVEAPAPAPEPEPAPVLEAPPAPAEAPAEPQDRHVPISAMMDERFKRQDAERRAAELQAQLEQYQYDQQFQQEAELDPYQAQIQQVAAQQREMVLTFSERLAKVTHGEEAFKAANEWALTQTDAFRAAARNQPDPWAFVIENHKRHQITSQITDPNEVSQFLQWKAAQAQLQPQPPAAPASPTSPVAPPPSQVAAPSAGNGTRPYVSDTDAFDGAFAKRK